jgi:hypothetical protein
MRFAAGAESVIANRHFARLADVWKHLVLCDTCQVED